ncbi:hypothetical protein EXS57_01805 [Candidatus Kaiserbacteria bacterium]|nr:hypothetical protein [Candidatus Kaiserbacteria bacterium]
MKFTFLTLLIIFLIPTSTYAARGATSFSFGRSLIVASSSPGNVYLAGISVVNTAPVQGDLTSIGGSVVAAGPVQGDSLLLAGSVGSRSSVAGDVRAVGGGVALEGSIEGDLLGIGYSVYDSARTKGSTFIVAANASLVQGATGPVIIYGNNIALAGDFASTVRLVALGRVSLAPGTIIRGELSYEAPEEAVIPSSAVLLAGVEYTNASYLPDAGTSRILALVSIGFFLFARILGALILAGLLAGLFPKLAETIAERAYGESPRVILLTMLLGFGIIVAAPVLIILLALTLVGGGIALLLFVLYTLLVLLSFLYAGILLGSMFARRFRKRETVLWRDGVFGMLALSLVTLVPSIGIFIVLVLGFFAAGALLLIFFRFAFPHDTGTPKLL